MWYLVSVDHNGMAAHLTWSDCEGSNALSRIGGDDTLWNDGDEDTGVRGECEEDKGSNCEDADNDTHW
jgi:hypothetical protein